ncbi:PREDICTED: polyadenylate-binding protein-interacting protein 3-like isoform X1 [Camelina sativa]|uniref:Polyadenylate-binding protein-interacting protein 3-like isoform X1 n=1 Tax=Camelina sativa TaxID=90675 RepID=A0ABM0X3E2_CAMSA|nr:PREDICTED: polyadenylate-binding protein-interacting protein 3-like isoform X1 [Camelina sativa]
MKPGLHSSSSSNGFPHRMVDNEPGVNKAHPSVNNTENGWEAGSVDTPSHELLLYFTTCKIGHQVEVHLKNGTVYSGIFHAANVEKDFGIILKMACLIRDSLGTISRSSLVSKPPSKLLIIPAEELVQVIAKDLPVSSDNVSNSVPCEEPLELLTDSLISQFYNVDVERELKPWVPDEDVPDCSDLENVFDDPWKRGWNQFEVNKTLFGVTSTFDEELYTTKLERGPGTRELEEQALRIAREIVGENTRDLHVAEERGLQLSGKFDIDEETKYSSVCTLNRFDDTCYEEEEEEEDILLDCCNNLTFGDSSASDGKKPVSTGKVCEGSWGDSRQLRNSKFIDQSWSNSNKHTLPLMSEQPSKDFPVGGNIRNESQLGERRTSKFLGASHFKKPSEESVSGLEDINEDAPPPVRPSFTDGGLFLLSEKSKSESSSGWPGSSISRNSENSAASPASNRPILSPSSSIGSLSSEKSTLNPNAKEFKLNPNAKSFKPSPSATTRPQSPVSDGSLYYPPLPPMPGLHLRYGMGAAFPGQQLPMMYNNTTQLGPNQTYYSPNGPQYPQPMMVTPQRPLLFMPPTPYQPEMPYKGRDSY